MNYSNIIRFASAVALGGALMFGYMQIWNEAPKQQIVQNVPPNTQDALNEMPNHATLSASSTNSMKDGYSRYTLVKSLKESTIENCGTESKGTSKCSVFLSLSGEVINYAEPRIAGGIFIERGQDDEVLRIIDVQINDGRIIPHGTTQIKIFGVTFEPEARHHEVIIDWGL